MKKIVVTGSTGLVSYSLLFRIANGDLFPNRESVSLSLYDIPGTEALMEGVAMELEDCAFPLISEIKIGTDLNKQFDGADIALLIGAKARGPGMDRVDLLKENGRIFVEQGRALNDVANRDVKVIVVGNPCNTNCLVTLKNAPNLSHKNFHSLVRLDQNRATAFLAKKAGVAVDQVKKMTIWGNHSATQVPDFTNATISGKNAVDVINDSEWLQNNFMDMVQKRGSVIIAARGKSSAASAAHAVVSLVRDLYTPTPDGCWFSSGVSSNQNSYGIEEDLIFGFPCRSDGSGNCTIVDGLPWNFFIKEKIAITQKELIGERETVRKEKLIQDMVFDGSKRNSPNI